MAAVIYNISNTGTNTTYASGSVLNDWSNADTFNISVLGTILGDAGGHLEDGDVIVFDEDTFDFSSVISMSEQSTISVTLKSRGGNADNCILSSSAADNYIFDIFSTGIFQPAYTFQNLTFTKSVTHTGILPAIIRTRNYGGDILFTSCKFTDITVSNTEASTTSAHIMQNNNGSNARTITYTSCTFSNSSFTSNSKASFAVASANNEIIVNDMIIDNIDFTILSGGSKGFFYVTLADFTVNGATITRTTVTGDGLTSLAGVFMQQPSTSSNNVSITNAQMNGTSISGAEGGCQALLLNANGSGAISLDNSSVSGCTNDSVGNSVGCLYFTGATASGTVKDCQAYNNRGFYGTGVYSGFSSTVIAERVVCYDNDGGAANVGDSESIDGVDFYSGGSGDATYIACSSIRTNADSGAKSSSVKAINNTAGTRTDRDKTVKYQNCSFTAPLQTAIPVARYDCDNLTTNDLTVEVTNTEIDGADSDNIILVATTGVTTLLNITTENSQIGTINVANHNHGTLTQGTDVATLIGTGKKWWTGANPAGADGEPFSDFDTDVGSIQSTNGPFHTKNL